MSKVVTSHERPGVYSAYEASAVVTAAGRRGWAAVAARSQQGDPGTLYTLGTWREALETFGQEETLAGMIQRLLANGAQRVLAVPVGEDNDYAAAFALLGQQENIKVVVCDSEDLSVQQSLRDQVAADAQNRRERIAVVSGGRDESVSQLVTRAQGLNSERVVLTAPGVSLEEGGGAVTAAAVAGAIAAKPTPLCPWGARS